MKNILFLSLLFAAASCFSQIQTLKPQSSEMYMPAPVSKKPVKEKRAKMRIYYRIGADTHFWDCDTVVKVEGGYIARIELQNGIFVDKRVRIVNEADLISINKLRGK